jgi:hypothetical protein
MAADLRSDRWPARPGLIDRRDLTVVDRRVDGNNRQKRASQPEMSETDAGGR